MQGVRSHIPVKKIFLLDITFASCYYLLTVGKYTPDLSLFCTPTYQPEVDAYVYRR